MSYSFVTGDTGSKLVVTCTDDVLGTAINLTGATVKLHWITNAGVLANKTMTVTSAATGVCEYQFLTGEIQSPVMAFEVEITDSTSKVITSLDTIVVSVRDQLG